MKVEENKLGYLVSSHGFILKMLLFPYLLFFCVMPVQNLPFIQNMDKRIQSASLLLDTSLGHCFVDGLEHRDENAIYNCLRAYAAIDNTTSAEEIFRTTVVAPSVHKVIPHGVSGMDAGSSDDDLENDYKQMKQYIDKECKFLLEISATGYLPFLAVLFPSTYSNLVILCCLKRIQLPLWDVLFLFVTHVLPVISFVSKPCSYLRWSFEN